jgi:lipoprotein signal peptidase
MFMLWTHFSHFSVEQKRVTKLAAAAGLVAFLDQGSKWAIQSLSPSTVQLNAGISFGWFVTDQRVLFSLLLLGFTAVFLLLLRQSWGKQPILAGVFLGGVLSNLADRVFWGGVRDWLPIPFTLLRNNLADWCIFLILALFFVQELQGVPLVTSLLSKKGES